MTHVEIDGTIANKLSFAKQNEKINRAPTSDGYHAVGIKNERL